MRPCARRAHPAVAPPTARPRRARTRRRRAPRTGGHATARAPGREAMRRVGGCPRFAQPCRPARGARSARRRAAPWAGGARTRPARSRSRWKRGAPCAAARRTPGRACGRTPAARPPTGRRRARPRCTRRPSAITSAARSRRCIAVSATGPSSPTSSTGPSTRTSVAGTRTSVNEQPSVERSALYRFYTGASDALRHVVRDRRGRRRELGAVPPASPRRWTGRPRMGSCCTPRARPTRGSGSSGSGRARRPGSASGPIDSHRTPRRSPTSHRRSARCVRHISSVPDRAEAR